LPIVVSEDVLNMLIQEIVANEGVKFVVDLENQRVTTDAGLVVNFEIDPFRKNNLLKGLDDIGLTLQYSDKIDAFESRQKQDLPWLWSTS